MSRWIYKPDHPLADEDGFVPAELYTQDPKRSGHVIKDIEPVKSPIDGSILNSRTDIREHEKKHQVRALGNDWNGAKPMWWDRRHEIARTGKVPNE